MQITATVNFTRNGKQPLSKESHYSDSRVTGYFTTFQYFYHHPLIINIQYMNVLKTGFLYLLAHTKALQRGY